MAKISAFLGAIIISLTNFFGISKTEVPTYTNDIALNVESPSVTPPITLIPTIVIQTIPKNSPTVTPTPTVSQELMEQCKNVSKPEKYFAGFGCYYDEYQNALKKSEQDKNKGSIDQMREIIAVYQLTPQAKSGLGDLFQSVCRMVSPKVYTSCTDSLERNVGRLSTQIYSVFSSEINSCTSKVAAGDEKMKERVKDSYWRWRMRRNIEELYLHCAKTNGTLDTFSF